jgi:hypothetical protein
MPKFVLFVGGADVDKRSNNPRLAPEMFRQYEAWVRKMVEAKQLVGSAKLSDQTGARLTVRGGQVVDGPFVEAKEAVGGYFVVEAPSLEDAVAIARDCPVFFLQNGYVEVRPVER